MKPKLELYCVTNKPVPHLEDVPINIGSVSVGDFPSSYIRCDKGENIFYKEKYYSELTFHYWYWKNKFSLNNDNWIGFCQKRRLWIKYDSKEKEINKYNFKDHLLLEADHRWDKFEAIICDKIFVNNVKKIKMIKRGWRNLIKDPKIDLERFKSNQGFSAIEDNHPEIETDIDDLPEVEEIVSVDEETGE